VGLQNWDVDVGYGGHNELENRNRELWWNFEQGELFNRERFRKGFPQWAEFKKFQTPQRW
jgi:hypothetical protein